MAAPRKYSDPEVRAILDRALANSAGTDGLSHDDLLSIGEQVGVSQDAMARAATELHEEQLQNEAERTITGRRRRWLGYHAALFALLNALAFAVNFLTTPGEWWSLFLIVPWALALILHAGLTSALPISESALNRERDRRAKAKRLQAPAPRLRIEAHQAPTTARTESEPEQADAPGSVEKTARR